MCRGDVPDITDPLRQALLSVTVIEGDARRLRDLFPYHWHGRIGAVIYSIPLVLPPKPEQRRFIDAIEAVAPGRGFCITATAPPRRFPCGIMA